MLYDVDTAAKKLNVSKMTIYNKIKLREFKGRAIKKAGKTYIDEDLLKDIQEGLKSKTTIESNNMGSASEQETATDQTDNVNVNKDLYAALMEQLHEKDLQIQELNNRLKQEQELHQNTQVLFKQQIPQDIKKIEAHFKEIDGFIDTWQQDHQHQEQDQDKKKGFFSRLFR